MSAPAREPGSSPVRPVSPFSSPRPPSLSACGTFRRSSPQGGSLLLRACEPGEWREHWSRALDPLQRWAERDGTARPRARALSGRLGPGWLGGSPLGAGVRGLLFPPPFGTRARATVHPRALWLPGSIRQVRGCGTNRSVSGVLPHRFQGSFPGPL